MRKGYTLAEVVLSMILFSLILVMFASLTSFNFRFTRLTLKTDDLIKQYTVNNTIIYKELLRTGSVTLSGDQLILDNCILTMRNSKLYYNETPMYELTEKSTMKVTNGLVEIHLEINNRLEQFADIVVQK